MRKTLISLLTAGLLVSSYANTFGRETEMMDSREEISETQKLYPDLRGYQVVSINFNQSAEIAVFSIGFITNKSGFEDTRYFYIVKEMRRNSILLENPFAVSIDTNSNQRYDKDERFLLKERISTELRRPLPLNAQGLFPVLKGYDLVGILFNKSKKGVFSYIQYNILSADRRPDIMYVNKNHEKIGNLILLESPSVVVFDLDEDGYFDFNSWEMFDLEGEIGEDLFSEKRIPECLILERSICT